MTKLTKKQGLEYKQQWANVESVQIQELQKTPMSLKFNQLCSLMDSFPFILDKKREKEEKEIRARWMKLKKGKRQDHGRS